MKELTDDAIAAHLEHGPKVPVVNSTVHIYPINGACHRVASDATAFAYRDATFATVIAGHVARSRPTTRPTSSGFATTTTRPRPSPRRAATSTSWPSDDQERIKANYKGNYDRLVDVKRKYDPDNLFHLNQNIRP